MPHANIWIRKENEDKWNKVADKSAWVNALLTNSDDTSKYGAAKPTPIGPMVTVLSETIPGLSKGSDFVPKAPDPESGYPCCQKASPCKHWSFNELDNTWVNQLTGKTREVL